ncbi:MAG TPA: hypothetical protein VMM77_10125, partial [Gemmatimonadaceae bacterium]|nr:hypothetical protein [Gemmatimonadaceae bacterium]
MRHAPSRLSDLARFDEKHDSLRRRLVVWLGTASLLLVAALAWGSYSWIERGLRKQLSTQLFDVAQRSASLVDRTLIDRARSVRMLGSSPVVIDAARQGAARSRELGLATLSIADLEARFKDTRSLAVDARAREYLLELLPIADIAEVLVTEAAGLNAVTSGLTSDFVQRDESWWTDAFGNDVTAPVAALDESAEVVSVSIAGSVRPHGTRQALGVIKVVFGVKDLDFELARAAERSGVEVALLNEDGDVIAGSVRGDRLAPIAGLSLGVVGTGVLLREFTGGDSLAYWAAAAPAAEGRWRVVAYLGEHLALAPLAEARLAILGASAGLIALMTFALGFVGRHVSRRVTDPAKALATAAERVATGDL